MQDRLQFPNSWGGVRQGAGRKKRKTGTAHATRPRLTKNLPALVTMKRVPGLGSFRRNGVNQLITADFMKTPRSAQKVDFRIVHYSIQSDHLHLIIEADDRDAMVRGMRGLGRRLGHHLNKFWKRTGSVFAHRFHERILESLRQVHNTLRYVLNNHRKHGVPASAHRPDPLSSGRYFDGWLDCYPTTKGSWVSARSWKLRVGWKQHYPLIPIGSTPGGCD